MGKMHILEPGKKEIVVDIAKQPGLMAMHSFIGGHIGIVRMNNKGAWIAMDNEGIAKGLPYNKLATEIYYAGANVTETSRVAVLPIVGTAVLFEDVEMSCVLETIEKFKHYGFSRNRLFFVFGSLVMMAYSVLGMLI